MSWGRTLVMLWMFLFAFVIFPLLWIYHLGNINCDDNETVALSHKKCNKKGKLGFRGVKIKRGEIGSGTNYHMKCAYTFLTCSFNTLCPVCIPPIKDEIWEGGIFSQFFDYAS